MTIGTSPCKNFSSAGANEGLKLISHARFPLISKNMPTFGRSVPLAGTSGKHGILWWKQAEKIVAERPRVEDSDWASCKDKKFKKHDAGFVSSFEIL